MLTVTHPVHCGDVGEIGCSSSRAFSMHAACFLELAAHQLIAHINSNDLIKSKKIFSRDTVSIERHGTVRANISEKSKLMEHRPARAMKR